MATGRRLGVGFIGGGFIAQFHIRSWQAVRDADVLGVWTPDRESAETAARLARDLRVGEARAYDSIADMVGDPAIDCLWICSPNHVRLENMEEIVHALKTTGGSLLGIACEKPLARNVAEARRMVELVEEVGVPSAYLEDQLFSPGLVRGHEIAWKRGAALSGRPYLARAAEEHRGPHTPWFWQGELQGGGVLNDMMCHSVEVARFLLTKPGAPRSSIRPEKVTAQIASLKWSRPEYADELSRRFGAEVDYRNRPSEDFARATIEYRDEDGRPLVAETTTSWSFVGAGLRLSSELLGPEYSMQLNSLDAGGRLFFSRRVTGDAGEDLVEKQNAEVGLMPVVADEPVAYGYQAEDRHFARVFLGLEEPLLTFRDGLDVVEILMAAYRSAEEGRTLDFPPRGIEDFVPAVARGEWRG